MNLICIWVGIILCIVGSVILAFVNDLASSSKATNSSSSKTIMSHIDKKDSGRCFSFTPSPEMISFGIRAVILRIWDYSKLYFDTRGLVKTAEETSQILIGKSRSIYIDVDYDVNHLLDLGGNFCNNEPEFDKDVCKDLELERESLERYGCTTPFGANKDKICHDQVNGSRATELYKDYMNKKVTNCNSPCSFLSTKAIKTKDEKTYDKVKINGEFKFYTFVKIFFKKNIKVIQAYHTYSGLSLIAEIGGYVGLFLGVSVNQVSVLMNILLDKIACIFNRKNNSSEICCGFFNFH